MRKIVVSIFISVYCISVHGQEILIWEDQFDGSALNTNYWSHQTGNGCPDLCGWGNNELQNYTTNPQNIRVQDGKLIITAINNNGNWTSGRVRTINKVDFCTGRIEIRAKIPAGRGFWPALWLLPTDYDYGGWPISGEIDIMEARGQEPETSIGSIHYGLLYPNNLHKGGEFTLDNGTFAEDFHIFSVEWKADQIVWEVDGSTFSVMTPTDVAPYRWPFDRNFNALINLAVGGNFLGNPDGTTPAQGVFEVDYIKLFQDPDEIIISGPEAILRGPDAHRFYTQQLPGYSIQWDVPPGATILSGQGTKEVSVSWGFSTGDIHATLTKTGSPSKTLTHTVQVIPENCSEAFDASEGIQRMFRAGSDGDYRTGVANPQVNVVNPSNVVTSYVRNPGFQYDALYFSTDLIHDATPFENGSYRFKLKVRTDAPVGSVVQILLEKREGLGNNYPFNRRLMLQAVTTAQDTWEELTFLFVTIPDQNMDPKSINQVKLHVNPNSNTSGTWYIDDWTVEEVPCQVEAAPAVPAEKTFSVYPNPFSSAIVVSAEKGTQFRLLDLSGRVLISSADAASVSRFLGGSEAGIFLLQATTVNGISTQKIIKQ